MAARNLRYGVAEAATISVVIALTVVAQLLFGTFPLELFAFPLNIFVMLLWLVLLGDLYRRRSSSAIAQYMLSMRATWLSLLLMAGVGILLGLQSKPASTSWFVVVSLLFTLSHLWLVILRGWRNKQGIRFRFILTHLGLWLALSAGFWGAPDRVEWRMAVDEAEAMDRGFNQAWQPVVLDYTMQLLDFEVDYYDNGTPASYNAKMDIDGEEIALQVNKPYNRNWYETIYLVSHGNTPDTGVYCIVEIVREPWRWLSATGIVMLMLGAVMLFLRGPQHIKSSNSKQS